MAKIFTKKLNKRGFTLAELLIVVAILAILIAVAVPVYTSAMKDAQKRVNQSNARALRGAAVSQILSNWTQNDGDGVKYSRGALDKNGKASNESGFDAAGAVGWYAWAKFDENGKMGDVSVRVNFSAGGGAGAAAQKISNTTDRVVKYDSSVHDSWDITGADNGIVKTGVDVNDTDTSGAVANPNIVVVFISGTDINK